MKRKTAKVTARRAEALDRAETVLAAIVDGATLEEAAEVAGYAGKQGAQKARDLAIGERERRVQVLADEYREQAERRVATAMIAIWPAVLSGDLDASDRYVRLEARWAKLRGGDAPTKLEHAGPNGGPVSVSLSDVIAAAKANECPIPPETNGSGSSPGH